MGLDKKILPHKRYSGAIKDNYTDRYFVDKFPMFYNPTTSLPHAPTFSFIDPGFESMDSFKTHLDAYLALFTKLPELRQTSKETLPSALHGFHIGPYPVTQPKRTT